MMRSQTNIKYILTVENICVYIYEMFTKNVQPDKQVTIAVALPVM
jgi:hypothetical protein